MYGDTLAPPADDAAFGPIVLDTPMIFFRRDETSLYVSKIIDLSKLHNLLIIIILFQQVPSKCPPI